ncbi:MAG: hypothetical protein Q8Q50_00040 [Methylobacter sp.]|jgi:hypothetical protein|nr:hypothetical protein [Methylobacter sp.]
MKTFTKKTFLSALTGIVIALTIVGCSDDKEKTATATVTTEAHNPFDHTHDVEVTDVQKHKFEHDFAAQCVQREVKNSNDKEADKLRYSEPCMCIAKFLMKDLTAEEAQRFIGEHKNAQSLVIKYENAAYHCLQQNAQPKGPNFSRKTQAD